MIWVGGAIVVLIIWWGIGAEVLMWIDRHEAEEQIDAEKRGDRAAFRIFSLVWPLTLILYGCFRLADYREEHPGSGKVKEWLTSGGLTHRYLEWRQRR